MIHLDTNYLVGALVPGSLDQRRVREWLGRDHVAASAIMWAEFLCGPVAHPDIIAAGTIVGEPVPFTAEDANTAARLFNRGGRRARSLRDCMIAAAAIGAGAVLATHNFRDFERFASEGLVLA